MKKAILNNVGFFVAFTHALGWRRTGIAKIIRVIDDDLVRVRRFRSGDQKWVYETWYHGHFRNVKRVNDDYVKRFVAIRGTTNQEA